MADGIKVNSKGLRELIKKLSDAPNAIKEEVNGVFENTAKEFVARAKRDAPKDVGFLAGAINYAKVGDQQYSAAAQTAYAGYMEFGTKSKFVNIPGFEDVAAQLKSERGGGTYEEGLKNITAWVRRKGIIIEGWDVEGTAWYIFHLILLYGIKPHPFFFKQVEPAMRNLEKDLDSLVKILD